MRVLIAIDGSPDGFEAVRQAARLVAPTKDQLVLYYSVPSIRIDSEFSNEGAIADKVRAVLSQGVFEEARRYLPTDFIGDVQEMVDSEDPREGIIAAADQAKADMIVVGARGLNPLARLLLGSVSRTVAHAARTPVLVARRPKAVRPDDELRVLFACDRPDTATAMTQLVCNLTWPPTTHGHSITVLPGLLVGQVPSWLEERTRSPELEKLTRAWVEEQQEESRQTKDRLARFSQCLPNAFRQNALVVNGYAADKILETIDRHEIDLVILGARQLGKIERFMIGSTSEAVLNHAPCSVLIIRDQDSAKHR